MPVQYKTPHSQWLATVQNFARRYRKPALSIFISTALAVGHGIMTGLSNHRNYENVRARLAVRINNSCNPGDVSRYSLSYTHADYFGHRKSYHVLVAVTDQKPIDPENPEAGTAFEMDSYAGHIGEARSFTFIARTCPFDERRVPIRSSGNQFFLPASDKPKPHLQITQQKDDPGFAHFTARDSSGEIAGTMNLSCISQTFEIMGPPSWIDSVHSLQESVTYSSQHGRLSWIHFRDKMPDATGADTPGSNITTSSYKTVANSLTAAIHRENITFGTLCNAGGEPVAENIEALFRRVLTYSHVRLMPGISI